MTRLDVTRYGWLGLLALLLVCSLVVAAGRVDERFDFSAAMEMWGDLVRDVDRPAYQLTRVSNQEEMDLGLRIASAYPTPGNTGWENYVEAVGAQVAQHTGRHGLAYQFHVSTEPVLNAWAFPGGQIYITEEMLRFLETEAELAAILGHEIAHVDLYHCVERYQLELAARHIGVPEVGQIADLAHTLVGATYQQYQELDADAAGVRMAVAAGYDPSAAEIVFARMRDAAAGRAPEAAPVPALAEAMAGALSRFMASHPPTEERERRLQAMVARNSPELRGRSLYIGRSNYQQRVPRAQTAMPGEWIQY